MAEGHRARRIAPLRAPHEVIVDAAIKDGCDAAGADLIVGVAADQTVAGAHHAAEAGAAAVEPGHCASRVLPGRTEDQVIVAADVVQRFDAAGTDPIAIHGADITVGGADHAADAAGAIAEGHRAGSAVPVRAQHQVVIVAIVIDILDPPGTHPVGACGSNQTVVGIDHAGLAGAGLQESHRAGPSAPVGTQDKIIAAIERVIITGPDLIIGLAADQAVSSPHHSAETGAAAVEPGHRAGRTVPGRTPHQERVAACAEQGRDAVRTDPVTRRVADIAVGGTDHAADATGTAAKSHRTQHAVPVRTQHQIVVKAGFTVVEIENAAGTDAVGTIFADQAVAGIHHAALAGGSVKESHRAGAAVPGGTQRKIVTAIQWSQRIADAVAGMAAHQTVGAVHDADRGDIAPREGQCAESAVPLRTEHKIIIVAIVVDPLDAAGSDPIIRFGAHQTVAGADLAADAATGTIDPGHRPRRTMPIRARDQIIVALIVVIQRGYSAQARPVIGLISGQHGQHRAGCRVVDIDGACRRRRVAVIGREHQQLIGTGQRHRFIAVTIARSRGRVAQLEVTGTVLL